jgi:hypothetical protein
MSDLHVVPGNEGFGLIDHIRALDERIGRLEMLVEEKFPKPFVYTEGWDKGFAQDGDPYGIQAEYLTKSANPDAAPLPASTEAAAGFYITQKGPFSFSLDKGDVHYGDYPTHADAEAAEATAKG